MKFATKYKQLNWKRVVFTDSKYWVFQYSSTAQTGNVWCQADDKPVCGVAKQ